MLVGQLECGLEIHECISNYPRSIRNGQESASIGKRPVATYRSNLDVGWRATDPRIRSAPGDVRPLTLLARSVPVWRATRLHHYLSAHYLAPKEFCSLNQL